MIMGMQPVQKNGGLVIGGRQEMQVLPRIGSTFPTTPKSQWCGCHRAKTTGAITLPSADKGEWTT